MTNHSDSIDRNNKNARSYHSLNFPGDLRLVLHNFPERYHAYERSHRTELRGSPVREISYEHAICLPERNVTLRARVHAHRKIYARRTTFSVTRHFCEAEEEGNCTQVPYGERRFIARRNVDALHRCTRRGIPKNVAYRKMEEVRLPRESPGIYRASAHLHDTTSRRENKKKCRRHYPFGEGRRRRRVVR